MCLGIPGKIVAITDHERKLAMADVSGVQREINISCIVDENSDLDECVGSWTLIHVGFAMSRINEAEAAATLEVLSELGEMQEELAAMRTGNGA
jgi:hydrogenase expression/formation protein HypC